MLLLLPAPDQLRRTTVPVRPECLDSVRDTAGSHHPLRHSRLAPFHTSDPSRGQVGAGQGNTRTALCPCSVQDTVHPKQRSGSNLSLRSCFGSSNNQRRPWGRAGGSPTWGRHSLKFLLGPHPELQFLLKWAFRVSFIYKAKSPGSSCPGGKRDTGFFPPFLC